ncbi:MAG TPA: hypothetical protein EYG85_07920 [Crocinitomix sp.]|nr:hypothetical protein [Crocinitomix sp.]
MTPTLPISYFGNIEYFSFFVQHQKINIDVRERYVKQTYRNRMEIYGANGKLSLSIPVTKPFGKHSLACQIEVSYAENWQKNHWKSIESAYRRTPFYEFYFDDIKKILFTQYKMLVDLNLALTHHLINKLGIDCIVNLPNNSTEITKNDLRLHFSPKVKTGFTCKPYIQTFSDRNPFINNLSILDLLFNEGPNSICVIEESIELNKVKP